ncbi:MAG: hypothetical protein AAGF99_00560 [Bacteroidota bacterium]
MGQQQLLLLVLGIVIVGLAVVTGIEAFQENDRKAALDRLSVKANEYATKMLAWKLKPQALGGGQSATRFAGLSLSELGLSSAGSSVERFNGNTVDNYWGAAGGDTYVGLFQLNNGNSDIAPHVAVYDESRQLEIAVFLHGPDSACFTYRLTYLQDGSRVDIPQIHPPNPDATRCSF